MEIKWNEPRPGKPEFLVSIGQLPSGGQFLADEEREITAACKEGQGHFDSNSRNADLQIRQR